MKGFEQIRGQYKTNIPKPQIDFIIKEKTNELAAKTFLLT